MTGSADNPPRWLSLDEKNSMQYGPKHGTFPTIAGLSGVPGVPWHPQILAGQLTLYQPWGADYAHHIITAPPVFSDLPTALLVWLVQQHQTENLIRKKNLLWNSSIFMENKFVFK